MDKEDKLLLEKNEYLVQITILEGRKFQAMDDNGTSDPFIKITVADLPPQVSQMSEGTTNAVWNQPFTFKNVLVFKSIYILAKNQ